MDRYQTKILLLILLFDEDKILFYFESAILR